MWGNTPTIMWMSCIHKTIQQPGNTDNVKSYDFREIVLRMIQTTLQEEEGNISTCYSRLNFSFVIHTSGKNSWGNFDFSLVVTSSIFPEYSLLSRHSLNFFSEKEEKITHQEENIIEDGSSWNSFHYYLASMNICSL